MTSSLHRPNRPLLILLITRKLGVKWWNTILIKNYEGTLIWLATGLVLKKCTNTWCLSMQTKSLKWTKIPYLQVD